MIRRWLFTGLLLSMLSCGRVEAQSGGDATANLKLEQEAFALINQYRKDNKLPVLTWSDEITKVARGHSKDMATGEVGFGHEGFGQRVKELRGEMPGVNGAGENVFKTDNPNDLAKNAVETWLHSPHHLANIRGDFNYSGMGIWVDAQGVFYFTQIFVKIVPVATPVEAQQAPPPKVMTPFNYLADPKTR
jgi:uncharacterized protein YkwD